MRAVTALKFCQRGQADDTGDSHAHRLLLAADAREHLLRQLRAEVDEEWQQVATAGATATKDADRVAFGPEQRGLVVHPLEVEKQFRRIPLRCPVP